MLSAMAEQVDGGKTLSTALRESGVFPVYVCGLVEVGERTGRTEEALAALSRYYEERVRIGRRVRSALLYPAVMLALMLVVIGVLLVKVLPIFDDVYASLGGRLTVPPGPLPQGEHPLAQGLRQGEEQHRRRHNYQHGDGALPAPPRRGQHRRRPLPPR